MSLEVFKGIELPTAEARALREIEEVVGKEFRHVRREVAAGPWEYNRAALFWTDAVNGTIEFEGGYLIRAEDRTRVTGLYLVGLGLNAVPKAVLTLRSLTYLRLGRNRLTFLPESIGGLGNLVELNLHHNRLTGLPESVRLLIRLTTLYLDGNPLVTLPHFISIPPGLTYLAIDAEVARANPGVIRRLRGRRPTMFVSDETGSANLYITPTGADDQYGIRVESTATNANFRGLFSRLQASAASTARCLEVRVNQSTQWMIQGRNDGNGLKFSVDGEGNTVTNDLNVTGDLTVNGAGIAPIASGTVGLAGAGIEVTPGWTVNQGLANLYTVIAPANSGYWELVATANMLGATNDNKARTVTVKRSGDGSFQIRTYQDNTGTESAFSFIAVRATPP